MNLRTISLGSRTDTTNDGTRSALVDERSPSDAAFVLATVIASQFRRVRCSARTRSYLAVLATDRALSSWFNQEGLTPMSSGRCAACGAASIELDFDGEGRAVCPICALASNQKEQLGRAQKGGAGGCVLLR